MYMQNLPQLSDNNYSHWKFRVERLLKEKYVKVAMTEVNEDELKKLDSNEKKKFKS